MCQSLKISSYLLNYTKNRNQNGDHIYIPAFSQFKTMILWKLGFLFITVLFVTAVTVIPTSQVALGQGESSPLAGMNFSEATEAYSDGGILEATMIIKEKEGLVANESVSATVYNGSLLGPTLHVKPGERMVVNYVNRLDQPTNLHFHGLHVSPSGSSDNVFRVVGPGETAKYVIDIPIDHVPGTFWYHAHQHQLASLQVGGGMSGMIVIEGLVDDLPGELQNIEQRMFAMKAFPWQTSQLIGTPDLSVPTYQTINGEINPVVNIAPGETQLWRLASIDPGTFYNIELPGHTFRVIAEDGNPVWEVWDADQLVLPTGKRYDVLVTGGENGTYPLKMLPYKYDPGSGYNPEVTLATVNVRGDTGAATSAPSPSSLVPRNDLAGLEVDRQRVLNYSDPGTGDFFIDGKKFSPFRIDQQVKLGDLEEWRIVNSDDGQHTFHIHVNDFQVMSVNGQRYEARGLQDTVTLPANGEVVIRIPFTDFVGKFVYHCHILPHEDGGMMGVVEVVDPFTPQKTKLVLITIDQYFLTLTPHKARSHRQK
jgi:suppressor of ftsI